MANPIIPGQFVLATLTLIDRTGKNVDPAGFLPIAWKSSNEAVLVLAGATGGVQQAFEAKSVGDADMIAEPTGLGMTIVGSATVEHPAGIIRGVVTVTGPLTAPPTPAPTPEPAPPAKAPARAPAPPPPPPKP